MRANHSPLQFFGLIATASVLASGVYANAALAGTMTSTTAANGASASRVLAGSSSASETGTPSRVDGTRTGVNSDRTSRAMRSVTTAAATTGRLVSPTSGPPASGSATPGQHRVQVTTPAALAKPASPTPAKPSTRIDIGVTPLVGGGNSAGASTGATVPSGTTTTTAPTGPSPADSPAGTPVVAQRSATPVVAQRSARQAPASQPQPTPPAVAALPSATRAARQLSATRPPVTQPVAPAQPTSVPPATQPVATPPSVTSPVATEPVATEPVATQLLKAQSAPLSAGNRTRKLHQLQTWVTQWLRAENDHAARPVTTPDSPLSRAPNHPSWGLAKGPLEPATGSPRVLAGDAVLESRLASVAGAPRHPEQSPKPPSAARPRAATPPPIPLALSPAPPVQTRLPVGGAAAASAGGIGSVAPSVVAGFEALALAVATILLVRFSLDSATWRSTLLASRLEHPG
jgi:hypothetical protein